MEDRNRIPTLADDILRLRKAAMTCLGQSIFSDPAWNLLLALYASGERGAPPQIGTVAVRAGLPRSTAIRWLTNLNQYELVNITRDRKDKRIMRVRLTQRGHAAVENSFVAARIMRP